MKTLQYLFVWVPAIIPHEAENAGLHFVHKKHKNTMKTKCWEVKAAPKKMKNEKAAGEDWSDQSDLVSSCQH